MATASGVKRLVLIHLHAVLGFDDDELRADARASFGGEVVVPSDGQELIFER